MVCDNSLVRQIHLTDIDDANEASSVAKANIFRSSSTHSR